MKLERFICNNCKDELFQPEEQPYIHIDCGNWVTSRYGRFAAKKTGDIRGGKCVIGRFDFCSSDCLFNYFEKLRPEYGCARNRIGATDTMEGE